MPVMAKPVLKIACQNTFSEIYFVHEWLLFVISKYYHPPNNGLVSPQRFALRVEYSGFASSVAASLWYD